MEVPGATTQSVTVPGNRSSATPREKKPESTYYRDRVEKPTSLPPGVRLLADETDPFPDRSVPEVSKLPSGLTEIYNEATAEPRREAVWDRGKEYIDYYVQNSQNPEGAKAKINASVYLGKELGLSPSVVFDQFDTIVEKFYGRKMTPLNAWESIGSSWKSGTLSTDLGELQYQQLMNVIAGGHDEELEKRIEALREQIPPPDEQKRSLPVKALKAAAEMAPLMLEGVNKGLARGLATGLTAGGLAVVAGNAGPQALVPEEIFTFPAFFVAGLKVGTTTGTIENILKVEAGLAFEEISRMKDENGERINPRIAAGSSFGIGAINAAIEMLQIGNIPGVDRLIATATREATKRLLLGGSFKEIAKRGLKKYLGSTATNIGEELAQESTNLVLGEVAKEINNRVNNTNFKQADADEVIARLTETAEQSALAFTVMGIPGTIAGGVQDRIAQNNFSQAVRDKVDNVTKTQEAIARLTTDEPLKPGKNPDEVTEEFLKNATPEEMDALIDSLGAEEAVKQPYEMTREEFEQSTKEQAPPAEPKSVTPGKFTDTQAKVVQAVMRRSKLDETQAGMVTLLMEMGARGRQMDLGTFVDTYYTDEIFSEAEIKRDPNGNPVNGYWKMVENTKNLIAIAETANFGTFVHEIGHSFFPYLTDDQTVQLREWTGFQGEDWFSPEGVAAQEKFADGLIEFLRTEKVVDEKTRSLFLQFRDFLQEIYNYLSKTLKLSNEIRQVYSELLGLKEDASVLKSDPEIAAARQKVQDTAEAVKAETDQAYNDLQEKVGSQEKAQQEAQEEVESFLEKPITKKEQADVDKFLDEDENFPIFQVAAYHGSPHTFNKFSTDYMGTGEGVQAFGWGLYFTTKEAIAKHYASMERDTGQTVLYNGQEYGYEDSFIIDSDGKILEWNAPISIAIASFKEEQSKDKAIAWVEKVIDGMDKDKAADYDNFVEALKLLQEGEFVQTSGRNLYNVTLHKDKDPSEYTWLDWNEPWPKDKQLNIMLELEKEGLDPNLHGSWDSKYFKNGSNLYHKITGMFMNGTISEGQAQEKASKLLLRAGIDGIRYPAESIATGNTDYDKGTNYVVFDDSAVTIDDHILFQTEFLTEDDVQKEIDQAILDNKKALEEDYTEYKENIAEGGELSSFKKKLLRHAEERTEQMDSILRALKEGNNYFENDIGNKAIVHPASREDWKYQVSYFDQKGPYSHHNTNELTGLEMSYSDDSVAMELRRNNFFPKEYGDENRILFQKAPPVDTPEFKKWFKDSKVVNSDGTPKTMYHGTPDGGYDTFKANSHFTENKEYADQYQNTYASSLGGRRKQGNAPQTYKVYLSIQKPFDTRIEENRKIFENEFYRKWGTGTPLMESGLPDWNDALDLIEWIEEEGKDFDGVIVDEGGTPDGGHRGFSWIPLSPEQIKSVDNQGTWDANDPRILFQTEKLAEKNMAVLHNLTASDIVKIAGVGGSPMPSIAITRRDIPFTQFGDITMVADEKIFSEAYNRDVWSPTVPPPEYSIDKKKMNKIDADFYKHRNYVSNMKRTTMDNLSNSDFSSPEELSSRLQKSGSVQATYLKEKGIELPEYMRAPGESDYEFVNYEKLNNYLETIDLDENGNYSPDQKAAISEIIWDGWVEYIKAQDNDGKLKRLTEGGPSSLKRHFDEDGQIRFSSWRNIRNIAAKVKDGEMVPDYDKREAYLKEKTDNQDFQDWLTEKLSPIFSEPYVKVGRSNKPYNIETIIDWMLSQKETSSQKSGWMDTPSLGKIASLGAEKTIDRDEIKKWGLSVQDAEAVKEQTEKVKAMDSQYLENALGKYKYDDVWNSNTDARKVVFDYAKKGWKKRSPSRMATMFGKYDFEVDGVSDPLVTEALDLIDAVMAIPTDYLEAKPRRVVGLDEFFAALVPQETSQKDAATKILEEKGIEVIEYDGTATDRLNKLQRYFDNNPDVLFQTSAHEEAVKTALEEGKPVPDRVLQEYADKAWADAELQRRAGENAIPKAFHYLYDEALNFDDKEDFKTYLDTFFFDDDDLSRLSPDELSGIVDSIWNAVHEQFLTRSEANAQFLEKMQERSVIETALYDIAQAGFSGGFGLNKVETSIIMRIGDEKPITDKQYGYLQQQLNAHPERYREAIAYYDQNGTGMEQIRFEQTMDKLEEAKKVDQADEEKAERLRLAVMKELKIESPDDIGDDLFKKFMKGKAQYNEIQAEYREAQKEVNKLEGEVKRLSDEVAKDDERIRKMSDSHNKVIEENRKLKVKAQAEARKELTKLKKVESQRKKQLRERRAMKDQMRRLAKLTMKKPGPSIHLDEKRAIRSIQETIDPEFRSPKTIQKRRDALVADAKGYAVPQEILDIANKKILNDFTMEELERVYSHVMTLTRLGRAKRDMEIAKEQREVQEVSGKIINQILAGDALDLKIPTNADETERFTAKKAIITAALESWKPLRIFEWVEGYQKDGALSEFFYWKIDEGTNRVITNVNKRRERMKQTLDTLGLEIKDLARKIEGPKGHYSADKVLSMYVGMQNRIKFQEIMTSEGMSAPQVQLYIAQLTKEEKALGEALIKDYEENYRRLETAYNVYTNEELGKQENYTPVVVTEMDSAPLDQQLARHIMGEKGVGNRYTNKDNTKERKGGALSIKLGELSIWQDMVGKQEHFIENAHHVRQMNRVLSNRNVAVAMKQKLDYQVFRWLQKYVSDTAQYKLNTPMTWWERQNSRYRRNLATVHLALNMPVIGRQIWSYPQVLGFADADIWAKAPVEMLKNPNKLISFVEERSPQIKDRSMNYVFEEIKSLNRKKGQTIKSNLERPLQWIGAVDKVTCAVTWKASYDTSIRRQQKAIDKGEQTFIDEKEAIRHADTAFLKTQPQARSKDLADIYRQGPLVKSMLMFSQQLNQLFNVITADMGKYWKEKNWKMMAMQTTGFLMAGIAMGVFSRKRLPNEPEELAEDTATQFLNTIPFLGKEILSTSQGWGVSNPNPLVMLEPFSWSVGYFEKMAKGEADEDDVKKAIRYGTEAAAILTGLPYTGPRRFINAVGEVVEGDPRKAWKHIILGGLPKEEK